MSSDEKARKYIRNNKKRTPSLSLVSNDCVSFRGRVIPIHKLQWNPFNTATNRPRKFGRNNEMAVRRGSTTYR